MRNGLFTPTLRQLLLKNVYIIYYFWDCPIRGVEVGTISLRSYL